MEQDASIARVRRLQQQTQPVYEASSPSVIRFSEGEGGSGSGGGGGGAASVEGDAGNASGVARISPPEEEIPDSPAWELMESGLATFVGEGPPAPGGGGRGRGRGGGGRGQPQQQQQQQQQMNPMRNADDIFAEAPADVRPIQRPQHLKVPPFESFTDRQLLELTDDVNSYLPPSTWNEIHRGASSSRYRARAAMTDDGRDETLVDSNHYLTSHMTYHLMDSWDIAKGFMIELSRDSRYADLDIGVNEKHTLEPGDLVLTGLPHAIELRASWIGFSVAKYTVAISEWTSRDLFYQKQQLRIVPNAQMKQKQFFTALRKWLLAGKKEFIYTRNQRDEREREMIRRVQGRGRP